jgi:signal transduction histidine kinase
MLAFGRDIDPKKRLQSFAPLVEQALDLLRGPIGEKRIAVGILGAGEAEMDGEMMQRVFLNIAMNAVQAVGPGGRLAVEVAGRSISFADDGPGIAPEILEKMFTPFLTSKTKGTGLGLAIAHKIVEAHGGTLEAENGPGGGATFTITL